MFFCFFFVKVWLKMSCTKQWTYYQTSLNGIRKNYETLQLVFLIKRRLYKKCHVQHSSVCVERWKHSWMKICRLGGSHYFLYKIVYIRRNIWQYFFFFFFCIYLFLFNVCTVLWNATASQQTLKKKENSKFYLSWPILQPRLLGRVLSAVVVRTVLSLKLLNILL